MKSALATFTPDDLRSVPAPEAWEAGPGATAAAAPHLVALAEAMGGLDRQTPYSPIVLAGLARILEAALLIAAGTLVHVLYVAPQVGYERSYFLIVPIEEIKTSGELIAALFFERLFGNRIGSVVLPLAIAISAAGNVMVVTFSHVSRAAP